MKPIRVSAVGASAAPRGGVGPWVRGAGSPYMLSYVARPVRRAPAPPGWWGALWDAHEHCASGGGLGGVGGPYTGEGAGHWGERCPPDSWLRSPQPCTLLGFDASPGSSTSEGVWRRGRRSVQRGGGLTDGRARLSGCLGLQRAAAGRARARGGRRWQLHQIVCSAGAVRKGGGARRRSRPCVAPFSHGVGGATY
jgi:hypothetical protein